MKIVHNPTQVFYEFCNYIKSNFVRGEKRMADTITVRIATEADAEALLAIYEGYVRNTAITFEYEVPSVEEFRNRIHHTLERYPYLVAEEDGRAVGYAYAGSIS